MTVQVEIAKRVDNDLVVAFQRLIPQLSKSNPAPTKEQLESIVASDSSHILLAKVDGVIVGSLTLVIFHIPTAFAHGLKMLWSMPMLAVKVLAKH